MKNAEKKIKIWGDRIKHFVYPLVACPLLTKDVYMSAQRKDAFLGNDSV
jgi:hypothetical protein